MIFFLFGEDSFRSSQKISEIMDKFLASDPAGSGLSVFEYEEKGQKQGLVDIFGAPSLLAPKRLIVVRNLIGSGPEEEKEGVLEYLEKNKKDIQEDKDVVVVFWEKGQPRKNGKIYKLLNEIAKWQNFERLKGTRLDRWIEKRMKEIDPSSAIDKDALGKLVLFAGEDMERLDKEIHKLVNYASGRSIGSKDIELLVKADLDINIFNTVDALANNDKKKALKLVQEHLMKGDDPFYLLSMFIYQFRNILKVADLKDRYSGNDYAIAKASGLHPFVVKKSLAQTRFFSLEKLKRTYGRLSELDRDIKTGKIDIRLALDKFIVEL
jgi:DNA polymerase-3 subunit delta